MAITVTTSTPFQCMNEFVDRIEQEHAQAGENWSKQFVLLDCLNTYYNTALTHRKFITQRHYCLAAIKRMNPPYYEGMMIGLGKMKR